MAASPFAPPTMLPALPTTLPPSPLDLRVLSVIPPMTQLNTPYPSTAYLTGFLRSRGMAATQIDLALGLVLALLSPALLPALRDAARAALAAPSASSAPAAAPSATLQSFDVNFERYAATLGPTLAFLQGRDATLAHRIASRAFLPEGPRFAQLENYIDPTDPTGEQGGDPLAWAFGALGQQDRARHLATLYLNDLADVLRDAVDPRFEFVRYAESLAMSQPSFEPLAASLAAAPNLIDRTLQALALKAVGKHQPDVLLVSVPFPGAVYAAFRIAQAIKAQHRHIKTVLGGGFVNTELRELAEPRVFDFFDAVISMPANGRCSRCSSTSVASAAPAGSCAPLSAPRAWFATSTSARPTCRLPMSARRPGTACRWTAICRCSIC